jgi:hypothetical protein
MAGSSALADVARCRCHRGYGARVGLPIARFQAHARLAHEATSTAPASYPSTARRGNSIKLWLAWMAVGVPLAWGIWMTLSKATFFFVKASGLRTSAEKAPTPLPLRRKGEASARRRPGGRG